VLSAFSVLLDAEILRTGFGDMSALDGLYLPILLFILLYVLLYFSKCNVYRFVGDTILFTVVLSLLPAVKYQFLQGGDVNYMYRIISSVVGSSTYDAVFDLPSAMVGIYPDFPGFIILNVIFVRITGLQTLSAYKMLFPVIYGILYPTSFYMLSGLITNSANQKRAIVLASAIPYALLPGAPWNYFMMPNYLAFLLMIPVIFLGLTHRNNNSVSRSDMTIMLLLIATMIVIHPLASLYTAVIFTGLLLVKHAMRRIARQQVGVNLSPYPAVFAWSAYFGWIIYSNPSAPFFAGAVAIVIAALSEGLKTPVVTQRLETAGLSVFLISHISKLAIGSLALIGLAGLARRKITEVRMSLWILGAFGLLFAFGFASFVGGYTLYDIYVGYRSLFLVMIGLTIAAGLGLGMMTKLAFHSPTLDHREIRRVLLGLALLVILTSSLFELYPTEYVNPSLVNAVHTGYEVDSIEFLNTYWNSSSQILVNSFVFQVAQSYCSVRVYDNMITPDFLQFIRLRQPLTTVVALASEGGDYSKVNIIYSSGFMAVNSTLR
jgi:hypothetical protein